MSPKILIMYPTVWLDGARPANTCIPPSFPWIRHKGMSPSWCKHHLGHLVRQWYTSLNILKRWPRWCLHQLGGIPLCLIQGKEDGIQVLAGLAPSSQTEGYIIRILGATKGGSYNAPTKYNAPSYYNAPNTVDFTTMRLDDYFATMRLNATMRLTCMHLPTIPPISSQNCQSKLLVF